MKFCKEKKFIFLHNRKCGGSSVERALWDYADNKFICKDYTNPLADHQPIGVLKEYFQRLNWEWDTFFKFTTIRNPWDRCVSEYFWCKKRKHKSLLEDSFELFITERAAIGSKKKCHIRPITEFAYIDGKLAVDEVIRMEDIIYGLPKVLEKFSIQINAIPHVNKTIHEHYRGYYNKYTQKLVSDRFASDVELGKYTF